MYIFERKYKLRSKMQKNLWIMKLSEVRLIFCCIVIRASDLHRENTVKYYNFEMKRGARKYVTQY